MRSQSLGRLQPLTSGLGKSPPKQAVAVEALISLLLNFPEFQQESNDPITYLSVLNAEDRLTATGAQYGLMEMVFVGRA